MSSNKSMRTEAIVAYFNIFSEVVTLPPFVSRLSRAVFLNLYKPKDQNLKACFEYIWKHN
jgi:hypothetical protein